MLNCFNATRLMSDALERPLRFREKNALTFHIMMCSGCRNFDRHLTVLHKASVGFVHLDDMPGDASVEPHPDD